MAQNAHLSAKVYGRVQGVFFRSFVRRLAIGLGLKGYVCNLPSGNAIEVQAEGDKEQLEKLIEQLRIGPTGARVKKVEINWSDHSGKFKNFEVSY